MAYQTICSKYSVLPFLTATFSAAAASFYGGLTNNDFLLFTGYGALLGTVAAAEGERLWRHRAKAREYGVTEGSKYIQKRQIQTYLTGVVAGLGLGIVSLFNGSANNKAPVINDQGSALIEPQSSDDVATPSEAKNNENLAFTP